MGPNPTRAYFWPAVNKRSTCLWLSAFWPDPKRFFLTWREKIEIFYIFRGNFPNSNPNHKWLTWHDWVKKFWPEPITTIVGFLIYVFTFLMTWITHKSVPIWSKIEFQKAKSFCFQCKFLDWKLNAYKTHIQGSNLILIFACGSFN